MILKDWLTIFIPASVTIIGLVVNYIATKNNIKNELAKRQGSIKLEKLLQCLEDYQETQRNILASSKLKDEGKKNRIISQQVTALSKIMDYVYLYGSEDACKIASSWQQYSYQKNKESSENSTTQEDSTNSYLPLLYSNLLIAQICFDVTGSCNKMSYYYKIKLNDYKGSSERIKIEHNKLVRELGLNDKLLF